MPHPPRLPTGLSPSSIELFHQCPRRYEAEKMKGFYSPPGPEAVLGTFVHRVLELLMQRDPGDRTVEAAKEGARLAWEETKVHRDFTQLKLDEAAQLDFRWNGWKSVENYFEMESPDTVEVVATERKVNCTIDEVPLRGIIDRVDKIDGQVVVSDYKNGKVTAKKYFAPKRNQLNLYAAMLRAISGELPARARLIYTAHSEFAEVKITPGSVAKVEADAVQTWKDIHAFHVNGAFPANPGPLCGWCPMINSCPEGKSDAFMRYQQGNLKPSAPAYEIFKANHPIVVQMPRRRRR